MFLHVQTIVNMNTYESILSLLCTSPLAKDPLIIKTKTIEKTAYFLYNSTSSSTKITNAKILSDYYLFSNKQVNEKNTFKSLV